MPDKIKKCKDCKNEFKFTEAEQRTYKTEGFHEPKRCASCRKKRRSMAIERKGHIAARHIRGRTKEPPAPRMSVRDAMDLVDDDMPDGAYWAMVAEMSGTEYGELGAELGEDDDES